MTSYQLNDLYIQYVQAEVQAGRQPMTLQAWKDAREAAKPTRFSISLRSEVFHGLVTFSVDAPTFLAAQQKARQSLYRLEQKKLVDQGGGTKILSPEQIKKKLVDQLTKKMQADERKRLKLVAELTAAMQGK